MTTVAFLLGVFSIGAVAALLLLRGAARLPAARWRMLGVSFGLGVGIVHWIALVTSDGGMLVSLRWAWVLAPVALVTLGWLWKRGEFDLGGLGLEPLSRLQIGLLSLLGLLLFFVFVQGIFQPLHGWDARAIYGTTAKIIFGEGGVLVDSIADEHRIHYHRNYPLLVPHLEASLFEVQGALSERGVKPIFPLFYVSLLLLVYSSARVHLSRGLSLLLVLLVAAPPQVAFCMDGGAVSGYADIPFAYYWGGAVLMTSLFIAHRDLRLIVLAGLFQGFSTLTKNEGLALTFLLPAGLALLLCFDDDARRRGTWWKAPLLLVTLAALVSFPWLVVKSRLPVFLDESYASRFLEIGLAGALETFPSVWSAIRNNAMQWSSWGPIWLVLGVAPVIGWGIANRPLTLFLVGISLSQVFVYTIIYAVTPHDLVWHVEVSWNRLLIHVLPVAALCCAVQLEGLSRWRSDDAVRSST